MNTINSYKISCEPAKYSFACWWIDSWIMMQRSVRHILRSLDQLLSVTLFPIMFMLLNRYVFGGAIDTGDTSYANFLFAGILVQTLAFGANYTTINIAVDMKEGIIDRFRSLPMSASALLVGHVTADLIRNIISAIIILVVGLLVGFRPIAGVGEWFLVLALSLLFTFAISWLSAILGLLVKSLEGAQWIGFVFIFPLTFISSAFVPTHTMPDALRIFAENQPVTHVINAIRAWLVGTEMGNSAWLAFLWCIIITAICLPVSAWLLRTRNK